MSVDEISVEKICVSTNKKDYRINDLWTCLQMKGSNSGKHASLIWPGINYRSKKVLKNRPVVVVRNFNIGN